eukprot:COSAG02_NODE_9228_length_2283_cov_2.039377_1_plen_168_part_00
MGASYLQGHFRRTGTFGMYIEGRRTEGQLCRACPPATTGTRTGKCTVRYRVLDLVCAALPAGLTDPRSRTSYVLLLFIVVPGTFHRIPSIDNTVPVLYFTDSTNGIFSESRNPIRYRTGTVVVGIPTGNCTDTYRYSRIYSIYRITVSSGACAGATCTTDFELHVPV